MDANRIRQTFLDYFKSRGHSEVASSPLVPQNDPTLFFTNAGMVQFKGVFTGEETRPYSRATTAQKVMRVSGKHNDLENVGRTPRHHTFFEMLGNFSFGDYFKEDAIRYAWDLLTNVYGIDPARLWVTVFDDDDEAAALWVDGVGLPPWKVVRMGAKENFWSMGDTGPCGPCSEIHLDRQHGVGPERVGPDQDEDRFLEIWNLVFMQFDRAASGEMIALPRPSIDTGMGLERLAAVLQGKVNNFDTDLFMPIIETAAALSGKVYGSDEETTTGMRVIADHSRAAAFLIADGIMPSKENRGYVLRRIMRRAIRHGVKLGLEEPFLFKTVGTVIDSMGSAFPELVQRRDAIESIVLREEEAFARTLGRGLKLFQGHAEALRAEGGDTLPGEVIFKLYDTFGFPVDLTEVIAEEEGVKLDLAGFDTAMAAQKAKAREAWVGSGEATIAPVYREVLEEMGPVSFSGYRDTEGESVIRALIVDGAQVPTAAMGQSVEIIVEETPFYGESGGQVGDIGVIEALKGAGRATIKDTIKPLDGLVAHRAVVDGADLKVGDRVRLQVDANARGATRRNHTATHLLHQALKEVLGPHVAQRGSLVAPNRLRFDFAHFQPMTAAEVDAVEDRVNRIVLGNIALEVGERSLDEAMASGVVALFGEKYGDVVRVVSVPEVSAELCGGIHAERTGDIGLFKILSEAGIASGVRRIEAQTGMGALAAVRGQERLLNQTAEALRAQPSALPARAQQLVETVKRQEQEIGQLKAELVERPEGAPVEEQVREIAGVKTLILETQADSPKVMREQCDRLRDKIGEGIVILVSGAGGKATLLVTVAPSLTARFSANTLIKGLAPLIGGKGGGRADMAQAGGPNAEGIPQVLETAPRLIAEM